MPLLMCGGLMPPDLKHAPTCYRPPCPPLQVSCLPAEARVLLAPALAAAPQGYARLGASCPPAAEDACWRCFHAALEPLYQAGKLGAVVFQFHLSFTPSQANLEVLAGGGSWLLVGGGGFDGGAAAPALPSRQPPGPALLRHM